MTAPQLRAALARLGLTQSAAARLWGLHPRTVRRWLHTGDVPLWVALALRGMERG